MTRDGVLNAAIKLAVEAHAGQADKAGEPYIMHPLRVMMACKGEAERIAAVLHDVVEDTYVTRGMVQARFGPVIAGAVDALTRRPGEEYSAFIERCARCDIARRVKLADLADNMNLERLGRDPTIEDARRQRKYSEARNVLMTAEYAKTTPKPEQDHANG